MPEYDLRVVAALAVGANIIVQTVKGLMPENLKKALPLLIVAVMSAVGTGVAYYMGRDLLAGGIEGFLAGAASVGLYEMAMRVPGVQQVWNERGWIERKE